MVNIKKCLAQSPLVIDGQLFSAIPYFVLDFQWNWSEMKKTDFLHRPPSGWNFATFNTLTWMRALILLRLYNLLSKYFTLEIRWRKMRVYIAGTLCIAVAISWYHVHLPREYFHVFHDAIMWFFEKTCQNHRFSCTKSCNLSESCNVSETKKLSIALKFELDFFNFLMIYWKFGMLISYEWNETMKSVTPFLIGYNNFC